ncbi:uncharacterized protein LOC113315482 [Papaver somniferum]|uniref:uncharacterized protein LOC113315482 n=1 Tax=Papaver somniferum TaxID=3469 RepID=UPI000E6F7243|nr:uncharacterized protein LOC113315482 [Papaver somniferum]
MELFAAVENLKFFNAIQIIREAVKIPAKSSSPLFLITTITLILPLSVIQLLFKISFFNFFTTLFVYFHGYISSTSVIHDFLYVLSLSVLSLLSTSVIVLTVASIYASKSVSFIPILFAIPRIFKHLMITFFYTLLLMIVNFLAFATFIQVLVWFHITEDATIWRFIYMFYIIYLLVSLCVTALWILASVISVVEPNVYGLAAMNKSKQLLQGRTKIAFALVSLYAAATWIVEKALRHAMQFPVHFMVKVLLGLLCLFMLVAVNLTGLLLQSVFYFACKSHHNQVVDKKVLYDHLCGYDFSGDNSVALNSPSTGSMDMQSLVKDDHGVDYQPVAMNAITEYV